MFVDYIFPNTLELPAVYINIYQCILAVGIQLLISRLIKIHPQKCTSLRVRWTESC